MAYTYIDEDGIKTTELDRYEFSRLEFPENINPRGITRESSSWNDYIAKYGDPQFVLALCDEIAREKDRCIREGIPYTERPMPDFKALQIAAGLPLPEPNTMEDIYRGYEDRLQQEIRHKAEAEMERQMMAQQGITPYVPNMDGVYINITPEQQAQVLQKQAIQKQQETMFHPTAPREMYGYGIYQQPFNGYGYSQFYNPYAAQQQQYYASAPQYPMGAYGAMPQQYSPYVSQQQQYYGTAPQPQREIRGYIPPDNTPEYQYLNGYYYPSSQYTITGSAIPADKEAQAKLDAENAAKEFTGYYRKVKMVDTGEEMEFPIYKGDYDDPTTPHKLISNEELMNHNPTDVYKNLQQQQLPAQQPIQVQYPQYNYGYGMMYQNISPMYYNANPYTRRYNYSQQPVYQFPNYSHLGLGAKPLNPDGSDIQFNRNPNYGYGYRPYGNMAEIEERKKMLRRKYSFFNGLTPEDIEDKVNREIDPFYDAKKIPQEEMQSMQEWMNAVHMYFSPRDYIDPNCREARQGNYFRANAAFIEDNYGHYTLAQMFRHELANMCYDNMVMDAMYGRSNKANRFNGNIPTDRDLKKTYDSAAYNELLREHAIKSASGDIFQSQADKDGASMYTDPAFDHGLNVMGPGGLMGALEDANRDDDYLPTDVIGEASYDLQGELGKTESSMNFFRSGLRRLAALHQESKENDYIQDRRKAYVEQIMQSVYEDAARRKFGV